MKNLSGLTRTIAACSDQRGVNAGIALESGAIDSGRFWSKVDRGTGDECWLWLGRCGNHGYGSFVVDGRTRLAHRVAFALTYGALTKGMCVLHECDTPRCVNPAHLREGSAADNMHDKMARGRHVVGDRLREQACWRHGVAVRADCQFCHLEARRNLIDRQLAGLAETRRRDLTRIRARLPKNTPEDTDVLARWLGRNNAVLFCAHFGIGDMLPMRLSELAVAAGVSRQRVDQIVDRCIEIILARRDGEAA